MDSHCGECGERIRRKNRLALGKSIKALKGLGAEHAALVAHAQTLADLVDRFPYETKLHSEYREVVKRLLEAGATEGEDAWEVLSRELAADDSARAGDRLA